MTTTQWVLAAAAAALLLYLAFVCVLVLVGRRSAARALAGFVPDCLVLFRRLLADRRIDGWRRAAIVLLLAYLAMPIDLVPDFIPVAGQLDDALLAAVVLRFVLRGAGPEAISEHWPGPSASLELVVRLAFGREVAASLRAPASRT